MNNYPNDPTTGGYPPYPGPQFSQQSMPPGYPQMPSPKKGLTAFGIVMTAVVICFGMLVVAAMLKGAVCHP